MAGSAQLKDNPWGKLDDEDHEPIVSFTEIMSEELAHTMEDEELNYEKDFLTSLTSIGPQAYETDEDMARALQREFDREYDLSVRLENEKSRGCKKVTMTPDRYIPKCNQDTDDEEDDDEHLREIATAMLYEKLADEIPSKGLGLSADGDAISKHDPGVSGRRNADKALNDAVDVSVGDVSNQQLSNKVFNSLRNFSKSDTKRQHKLKDKEEKATIETSVDAVTRLALFKWINQGLFDRVEGVIATGKESAVLHAIQETEITAHFAVKSYKTSLTEFKNRSEYVKDDFRFKNPRGVLKIWAEREYMNLKRMFNCNLPCPTPIKLKKNLLLMSLIGENGIAAPRLRNVDWNFFTEEQRRQIFDQVKEIMRRMFTECKLVHGDLSEFNLLLDCGKVFVIDVSQSMDISHPRNLYYLSRDIRHILSFFEKIGTPELPSHVSLFNWITDLDMVEGEDLLVQVEQFSHENRCVTLRNDKSYPADMELRLYQSEQKQHRREESPSREYN